ncbi:E3 ubiquitin-protein ligase RSL1-like [Salvia hispanica]|uniref:E3 ubiquitin-protein ligase RSL1-like n=1 Tax=Salvia hispanica TaxID=49212 RepID=UPI0020092C22|nr:E3 ubiquitin-protein ligase RSL1-like [Salvia hispanica]
MGNSLPKSPQIEPPQNQHEQQELGGEESEDESSEFTCEICVEPAPKSEKKFRNGDKCHHPFCTDCVAKYIRVEVEDHNSGRVRCPAVGCRHELLPLECAEVVGAALLVRWCDVLCESAIAGVERCYCPNVRCNELIVNECGEVAGKSKCPNCKEMFCFECKGSWHAGFTCEESVEDRDGGDVAFGILVEQNKWRRCPRCRHFVELMEGCPIIRCRCGSDFCYRCQVLVDKPWCRCMTASLRHCRVWCYRICILILFLNVALLFSLWGIKKHKRINK